ncbi:MAG: hypothetical protein C0519_16410 [Hyphomicrobium sp.]|nr:hypothetical protein [Hyphomicrobium sp.]
MLLPDTLPPVIESVTFRLSLVGLLLLSPLIVLVPRLDRAITTAAARALEGRFQTADLMATGRPDGVIVLGGTPGRVIEAMRLAERFPGIPVVLSGPGDVEVALALKKAHPTTPLTVDRRATNTYENALYSKDLVAPRPGECWVVVTSALHMPRAVGAFDAVGFQVLPWPVDDTPQNPEVRSARVWHEVFGLMGYWAFGRSSKLYPGQLGESTTFEIASY